MGDDFDDFDTFPEGLCCSLCFQPHEFLVNLCSNSHPACTPCANKLADSAFASKCPHGCVDLLVRDGRWPPNVPVNSMLSMLKLRCKHIGCTHRALFRDMRSHFQVCDFAVSKCPIAGCTWTGPKREVDGHLTNNPHTQFLGPVLLDLVAKQKQIQDDLSTVSANLESTNVRLTNMNSTWNGTHQTVIAIEQQLKAPEASERSVRRWKQTIRERDARIMNLESELRAIKSARVERCRDEDASYLPAD